MIQAVCRRQDSAIQGGVLVEFNQVLVDVHRAVPARSHVLLADQPLTGWHSAC